MIAFVLRRLGQTLPVLVGVSVVTWALVSLAPGDPAQIYARQFSESGFPSQAEIARARQRLGLDGGVVEQYLRWAGSAVTGDLGVSFRSGSPVTAELAARLPATLQLAFAAMAVIVLVGVTFGVAAALTRDRWPDLLLRGVALLGGAVPSFVLALLLIGVFAVSLGWLPSVGRGGWRHVVLPAAALGLAGCGVFVRLVRAALLDSLAQEYVLAARARGLGEWAVVVRHALRNALAPVISQLGLTFGLLLSGAAIIEVIFAWPGAGKLAVDAINARDYPVVQGFVLASTLAYIAVNLAVDVAHRLLDPRVGDRR
ncbi:MAG: nickel ABC transporter permease [Egibacteraceae bacterium]